MTSDGGFVSPSEQKSLMHGLWLQLAGNISGGAAFRSCARCGELFETGPELAAALTPGSVPTPIESNLTAANDQRSLAAAPHNSLTGLPGRCGAYRSHAELKLDRHDRLKASEIEQWPAPWQNALRSPPTAACRFPTTTASQRVRAARC